MDRAREEHLRRLPAERLERLLVFNAGLPRELRMDDELFRRICAILADRAEQKTQ